MLSFVLIKTLNMVLNGTRGIALATILGPASYGVFGTLIVIQQYLSYAALGMREGVAIRLARSSSSATEVQEIYSSALFWGACVGATIICAFLLLHFALDLLPAYFVWIGLVSSASILNEILININRQENRLKRIAAMEFVMQASVLGLVLSLWKWMAVTHAVQALLIGLLLGMTGYFATVRTLRWRAVSRRTTRELVQIGLLPAIFSAVVIVFNSYYVLLANWLKLGKTVGLVVFASNVSVMILFGLNTISWALASKSMARLYAPPRAESAAPSQTDIADVMFRLGVVAAVLIAVAARVPLIWTMKAYAGSGDFILYFCLFQSYQLLLFSESNFLNVNSRLPLVLVGYSLVMVVLGAVVLFTDVTEFLSLLKLGVFLYFLLAICMALYAKKLGFSGGSFRERIVALCFPVICVVAGSAGGYIGVTCVAIAFLLAHLVFYRKRTLALVQALTPKRASK